MFSDPSFKKKTHFKGYNVQCKALLMNDFV